MKYCTNCGTQLSDDARFCSVCGTKQEAPKKPAAAPKKPAAQPRQAAQRTKQAGKPDGSQEEYFAATETAGEVVLSSWESPRQQQHTYQQQTPPPSQHQTAASYQQPTPPPRQQHQRQNYQQPPQQSYQQAAAPQKKKRGFFSWILIILMVILVLYFLASILEGCKNANLPPDPGTPEPAPLSGVFACGSDTLFFNGDGKSITWHFSSENAKSGVYTFIFGHGKARYDVAERLVLSDTTEQASHTLILAKPATDTLIQIVSEDVSDFRKIR